ncbi:hypothetical protein [Oerskovia merdavium]|uniref:Uncharacterized protein n=1 Tax=Oerskovia merdavium TaxID=2762227 RepID=A0ABR8TUK9_9CELL|nr:hypothetical protein [Oerskovia merdavium]MBD7979476.1 hypothetical protein [Oerskovia merdavium]
MDSTTGSGGVAVLALFVLWFAYYVPHRVKQRQQLQDARVEDRFSGSLRVLAVVSGRRRGAPGEGAEHASSGEGRSLLLGPVPVSEPDVALMSRASDASGSTSRVLQVTTGVTTDRRPSSEEEPQTMETDVRASDPRPSIPPRRQPAGGGFDDPFPPRKVASPSRIAMLERRAKAARRRLALTVVLLLASVGAWVAFGYGLVPWYAAAGPTAVLALVLVLGRQAALAGKRADASWHADRRTAARDAARAARGPVAGSPVAPRNVHPSRVTGHAVRSSQTSTQMIPRVTAEDLARGAARGRDQRPATGSTARVESSTEPDQARPRTGASGGDLFDDRDRSAGPAGSTAGDAPRAGTAPGTPADLGATAVHLSPASAPTPVVPAGRPETPEAEIGGAWDPVPVPRPTYTMKPTAEETGVPPVQVAVPTAPLAQPTQDQAWSEVSEGTPSGVGAPQGDQPVPVPAPGDEKKPRTETLGLDLNEILARRRVSGQ